jgi:methylmalonyl-CoA mutase cobalamin-binding subunit
MDGLLETYDFERGADRALVSHLAMRIVSQMAGTQQGESGPPRRELIQLLARAARSGDPALFAHLQNEFRLRRISAERVIDVYIPATVAILGEAWHNDEIGILDATIAFARLQDLLRELGIAVSADAAGRPDGPRVLTVIPEREQHTICALLAVNRMRRLGVSVSILFLAGPDEVCANLAEQAFSAVFLSASNRACIEPVEQIIRAIRRAQPVGMPIALGGALVSLEPGTAMRLGADVVTDSIDDALRRLGLIAHPPDRV